MPIIPLDNSSQAAYLNSIDPFINSLFNSDVRDPQAVVAAAQGSADVCSFVDPKSRKIILESWLAAWKVAAGEKGVDQTFIRPDDQSLIDFLSDYIKSNGLALCTRKIWVSGLSTDPNAKGVPFYQQFNYERHPFLSGGQWSYGTFDANGEPNGDGVVVSFLWLLFHGAHIVVVSDDGAQPAMKRFDEAFDSSPYIKERSTCAGNSHYGGSYGGDEYFLDVEGDVVPPSKPFFLALLVGDTTPSASSGGNGFMQLEGWQAQPTQPGVHGGPRHEMDLKTHEQTIWNISTYGASAYSEKRCTPVFLARNSFNLALDRNTHMPKYSGATTVQNWMIPGYITQGPLDEILADVHHDNTTHLYLFQRSVLIHWDTAKNKADDGYPMAISQIFPGLKAVQFDEDIDAAFGVPKGHYGDDGMTYFFFKGDSYVHYDPSTQTVKSQHKIVGQTRWPGLDMYFTTISAATYVPSSDGKSDSIYFFSGKSFVVFDVTKNKLEGPPYNWRFDANAVDMWPPKPDYMIVGHGEQAVLVNYLNGQTDDRWGLDPHLYGPHLFPGLAWD